MAIDFYPFDSHHQILGNGINFSGYHHTLTIYLLTKVRQATYYFSFTMVFHPLLNNNVVNSWLHLGMISSLRGIKEIVDQVPVF